MINLEKHTFYKIFHIFLFIFCFKEIFFAFQNMGPESFYNPNGVLYWLNISYSQLQSAVSALRWILIFVSAVLIFTKHTSKFFTWLQVSLLLLITVCLSFRFSFSHYPQLEMYAVLILIAFLTSKKPQVQIETALLACSIIYFFSALSKLRYGGLDWLNGELIKQTFLYSVRYRPTLVSAELISAAPVFIWQLVGIATLVFELILPVWLFKNIFKRSLFFSLLLFHLSIAAVVGIYSTSVILVLYLVFIRAFCRLPHET